jgi:hypothetical protein
MLQQSAENLNQVAVKMEQLNKRKTPPLAKRTKAEPPSSPLWAQLNPLLAQMVEKLRQPDTTFYVKLSQPDMAFFKKMYRRNVAGLEYLECQCTALAEKERSGWFFTEDEKSILQTLIPSINRLGPETFFGNLTHEQAQSICAHLLELRKRKARAAGA